MPDGIKSFDDLYKGVAANKEGLTPDQFKQDMSDPDKRYRLWKNLTLNKEKGIPSDYSQFTKTYGFDQPVKKEAPKQSTEPPVGYPTAVQEGMEAQMLDKENKEKQDLQNGALLATGQWVKDANGNLIPKDPHGNRDDLLKKGADDYFEGFMSSEQKKAQPYVNAFYSAKTPYEREHLTNAIKQFIPDWTPLPKAQWSQLQETKSSMYLDALMKRYKLDSTQKSALENMANWTDEQKASVEQGGELSKNMDDDAMSYAQLAYLGQNAGADPSKMQRFFSHLGQGISSFATEGVFNPQTQDEWNQRATDILQKNGITLQTKEQAEAANPTFGEKLSNVSGSGASIILPMIAGSWAGEMMSLPELTKGLSNNSNKLLSFGGKLIGKSLETAVPLQLMNWKQSVTKTGAQAGVFSFGDMIMDRIPYKPVSMLGKVLFGITKGVASGAAYTALEPTIKAGIESIKNDDSFKKEFGKYSPETQDYVSQMVMMGVMGGWGGYHGTPEQKMAAENELLKADRKDVVEGADAILNNNNEAKINSTVADLKNTSGNPTHKPFPVQETQPITVNDDSREFLKHDKDLQIEQNKPSSDKAMIRNFGNSEDDIKDAQSFQKEAQKKGLITKKVELKNKDGQTVGTRMIVTDPKHVHLGNRIYELSTKELTTGLSPDEMHELGALTGQDNVKWLESAKKQAQNQGIKDQYDNIIKNISDKTIDGNGAKNEVAQQLRTADELEKNGHKSEAFKARQQAEITALKYGGKVHWEGNDLRVEFNDEKAGTQTSLKTDNADKLVEAVKSGNVEEAKEIGNKEGLSVRETPEGVQVHDGEKLVMQTTDKNIEDYANPDMNGLIKAIGNTPNSNLKETVQIQGMTQEEIAKGIHDHNNNIPSVERTKLYEAANKMATEGVITDKDKHDAKDFRTFSENATPLTDSPVNKKPDVKYASKAGETSIDEVKKKSEEPQKKSEAQKLFTTLEKHGKEAFPRVSRGSNVMSPKELEKAISDIKSGKQNQGTKDLMETLEHTLKTGEVEIGKAGALGTGKKSIPLDEYLKGLEEPDLTQYHEDYEKYYGQLSPEERERLIGEAELPQEVSQTTEGKTGTDEGKGTGTAESPIDITNVQQSGFGTGVQNTVLGALGLPLKRNVENLTTRTKPYALAWNNAKGNFTDLFNKKLPVDQFKNELTRLADEAQKAPVKLLNHDEIVNRESAKFMENMADAINTQEDIDNMAKVIKQENKFFIGGKEYYANNLNEVQAMKDMRKGAPLSRKDIMEIRKNIGLTGEHIMNALEGTTLREESGHPFAPAKLWTGLSKALTFQSHLHAFAPKEIRSQSYQMLRNVNDFLVRKRHSDMWYSAANKSEIVKGLKGLNDQKIYDALIQGVHQSKEWTTGELEKQGLNEKEITTYHAIRNWLNFGHDTFSDSYKYINKFWDMKPEAQKKYMDNLKNYVADGAGHLPLQRNQGDYSISAWGKNPDTGIEGRYYQRFEKKEEAEKEVQRLIKEGYTGVSDEEGEKGFGGKAEGTKPFVDMVRPKEEIASKYIRDINQFEQALEHTNLKEDDKAKIKSLLEDDNLMLSDSDRNTVNSILEKTGFDEPLRKSVIDNLNRFKKKNMNPHFMSRSYDINGNIVHGYPSDLKGLIDNIDGFNNRAIQNKARAGAFYTYDKNSKFLKGNRYSDHRKDWDSYMESIKSGTISPKGLQTWQNVLYYANLALKPVQIGLNMLHPVTNVYPLAGDYIDKINIERKQKGLPEYKAWASLITAEHYAKAIPITTKMIFGKKFSPEFEKSSFGQVLKYLGASGKLHSAFMNYIDSGKLASKTGEQIRQWAGLNTELYTRVMTAYTGHDLGIAAGLKGDELNKYAEEFLDKGKFEWNRYNAPQVYKLMDPSASDTLGKKIAKNAIGGFIRGAFTFKGFHMQDLGFNKTLMQEAEKKIPAFARVFVPRVIVGGGVAQALGSIAGVGPSTVVGIYNSLFGKESNEKWRTFWVKHLGTEKGNFIADSQQYGLASRMTGIDFSHMMDAGTMFNENYPLFDQIKGAGSTFTTNLANTGSYLWHGQFGKALESLPGEAGNIFKGISFYNKMQRKEPAYQGMGSSIIPKWSNVALKFGGFTSVDWEKYYMAEGFKHDMLGSGSMEKPDANSTVGKIQSAIRDEASRANPDDVKEYLHNPTKETFIKAFNSTLWDRIDDYNTDLYNNYYMAKQAMNRDDFPDSTKILSEVKKYAIGVTHDDKTWMDLGSVNNHFVFNAIRSEKKKINR